METLLIKILETIIKLIKLFTSALLSTRDPSIN